MSASFYRVLSARDEAGEGAGAPPLLRESYACRERPDLTLFLWREADGRARRLQFLFGERFLEWFDDRGWVSGATNRAGGVTGAAGRGKGVRTLVGRRADASDPVLREGLALLAVAAVPAELAGLRDRLVDELTRDGGPED